MAALEVLATLTHAGLRLVATDQGTLRVTPSTAITAEHRALIQAHKLELLKLLASAAPTAQPAPKAAQSNTGQTNRPVTVPPAPPPPGAVPPQLQALLRAASSDLLPSSMTRLANGGMVADLNRYVMAYAVVYLLGDTDNALSALWLVHTTLNGNKGVN
jgi:hypothetical protein